MLHRLSLRDFVIVAELEVENERAALRIRVVPMTVEGQPAGVLYLVRDMTELRQRYGITQQHTFVQIDSAGMSVKKWTGTKDGAAIKAQTT